MYPAHPLLHICTAVVPGTVQSSMSPSSSLDTTGTVHFGFMHTDTGSSLLVLSQRLLDPIAAPPFSPPPPLDPSLNWLITGNGEIMFIRCSFDEGLYYLDRYSVSE